MRTFAVLTRPCPLCQGTGAEACPQCSDRPQSSGRRPTVIRHDDVAHSVVAALGSLPRQGHVPGTRGGSSLPELLDELVRMGGGYVAAEQLVLERSEDGQVLGAKVVLPGFEFLITRAEDGSYTWRQLMTGA